MITMGKFNKKITFFSYNLYKNRFVGMIFVTAHIIPLFDII